MGLNPHSEPLPANDPRPLEAGVPSEGVRLHKPGVAGSSPAAATALLRFDESNDLYHSDKQWWSKSQLWDLVDGGPEFFHARHLAGTVHPFSSPALEKGTRVHEWAEQGPDAWWSRVVEIPASSLGKDGRWTKATDEFHKSAFAARQDCICLSAEDIAEYRQQFDKLLANKAFRELTEATEHREFSIRWIDPVTGLKCKCRPDAATVDCVWDIKTTREKNPLKGFWKSVVDFGYAFQAVHYLAGARAAGIEAKQFVFVVTSTVAPFRCHAVVLPQRLLDQARMQWSKTLSELRDRIALDDWSPEDGGEITELFIPGWVTK